MITEPITEELRTSVLSALANHATNGKLLLRGPTLQATLGSSFALAFKRGSCAAETQRVLVVQRQHDGRLFCTALCHLGHNSSGRQRIAALRVMKNLALTGVSSLHQCARALCLSLPPCHNLPCACVQTLVLLH